MTKAITIILVVLAIAALSALFGWALYATRDFGSWTGGTGAIALAIVGGVVATGGLTGGLMWLAFYSSRKGYDDIADRRSRRGN